MNDTAAGSPAKGPVDELRERLADVLRGRYTIRHTLGAGGMGVVFLAEEVGLEREVAIKVLPPKLAEDPSVVTRFQREAKTAARLDHAHIIPIYRVESEGGLHYFVMKYVAGRPLDVLIAERGKLPVPLAVRILSESAAALEHAHRKGVVHRDIKPANILLDTEDRVLLADFGIAKAVAVTSELTNTGVVIGTPYYMSPEQALSRPVDGRSDQYSLAVVGYRMLTGEALFDGDSAMAILYKHIHTPPPRPRERRPDVPGHLELSLLRALSKSPADRFGSMADFARAVRGEAPVTYTDEGTARLPAVPESANTGADTLPMDATPVPWGRRPAARFAALGVVALLGAGGWWAFRPAPTVPLSTPAALSPRDTATHAPAPVVDTGTRTTTTATRPSPVRRPPARDATPTTAQRPAPAPDSTPVPVNASLTVNATPFGTLFVDDVRVGGTPVVNFTLARGDHSIRVEREGCRAKEERVSVTTAAPIRRLYTLECTP